MNAHELLLAANEASRLAGWEPPEGVLAPNSEHIEHWRGEDADTFHIGECFDCGALVVVHVDADGEYVDGGMRDCSIRRCLCCGGRDTSQICCCNPWKDDKRCKSAQAVVVRRAVKP